MKTIYFTSEDQELDYVVVLAEHDLPKDFEFGTELRKKVTHYAGTYTSVQVNGFERMPIEFEGTVDDTWWGLTGHAARFVNNARALAESGVLVRFGYDDINLWGTFDAKFTRYTESRYDYSITFDPEWAQNPKFIAYIDVSLPPGDIATAIQDRAAELVRIAVDDAPEGFSTAFLGDILLDLRRAQSAISAPLAVLAAVDSYADLTERALSQTSRSLFGGIAALGRVSARIARSPSRIFAASPAGEVLGYGHASRLRTASNSLRADTLGILRDLIRARRPVRRITHIVRDGDTLSRLAQRYLLDHARWPEIADANDLVTNDLFTGQVLDIPPRVSR